MINHARTLLLNCRNDNLHGPVTEFVPPEFKPVPLRGPLHDVYTTLFGTKPLPTTLELRTRQYLAIWHASRFANQVLRFDPRITYDPFEDITATFVTITDVTAALGGINPSGVLFPAAFFPLPYFQVAGVADVTLVEVPDAHILLATPNFDMQGEANVAQVLLGLEGVTEGTLTVFGTEQTEPWLTCRNLWHTATAPAADRLGAFLTAYTHRLEALRG